MNNFLSEMARSAWARCENIDRDEIMHKARAAPMPKSLATPTFGVIAEVKPVSPSEGELGVMAGDADAAATQVSCYEGALAVSVLTEPSRFGGSLEALSACAMVTAAPVMRKDFLVDPIQLHEARAAGGSGALIIVRMLDDNALSAMLDGAQSLGLFTLLECFDETDCVRATIAIEGRPDTPEILVGVNRRDLTTLKVNPARFEALAPLLPKGPRWVAESGIKTAQDAAAAARLGYRAVLVGSALMQHDDPKSCIDAMQRAGTAAIAMEGSS